MTWERRLPGFVVKALEAASPLLFPAWAMFEVLFVRTLGNMPSYAISHGITHFLIG